jgi:hypothetical protein
LGRRIIIWTAALAAAFAFRLTYGLSSIFWTEDERQVYLIGLRSFARDEWPYFGADVVWTGSQLPGALQGLLVRWPLEVWPAPEAPLVLLNLLSFGTLALLAWYCGRRVPDVPRWLVWGALLTLPWTLNFSTHIVNTSYILPGAIVFFVGFFEAGPTFAAGLLPRSMAWAMMGAGLLFLVQIHMSWVLLVGYTAFAAFDVIRRQPRGLAPALVAFTAGACMTGILLFPTLLRFGVAAGGIDRTVQFQPQTPAMLLTIVARVLSFPAFETNRFLGLSTADRVMVFWHQPWVLPFALFVTVVGFAQPVVMAIAWFRGADLGADWRRVRWLMLGTMLWIYATFFFSVRGPLAHAFYVVFPVAAVYACYCWQVFFPGPSTASATGASRSTHRQDPKASRRSRAAVGRDQVPASGQRAAAGSRARVVASRMAVATLVSGAIMHAGLALDRLPRQSLYRDRPLVAAAIAVPNDRFLGDRRDSLQERQERGPRPIDPVPDAGAYNAADPTRDLVVQAASWAPTAWGQVSRFTITIANTSPVAAYVDLRYESVYVDDRGRAVETRNGVIKEILQPGQARLWDELIDGLVPDRAAAASLRIVAAEKCIPAVTDPILRP